MTQEQRAIAKRWCILNSWGWPDDLPMPDDPVERFDAARAHMRAAVTAIGKTRCLEYWNSEEYAALRPIEQRYGWPGQGRRTTTASDP